MQIPLGHWNALGTSTRHRLKRATLVYLVPAAIALVFWQWWDRSISGNTITMMATVQAVVATVLLTVMASIYSGLPGAIRRARQARKRQLAEASPEGKGVPKDTSHDNDAFALREEFERKRLEVLRGLFAHSAMAVALAVLSLPVMMCCAQCGDTHWLLDLDAKRWVFLVALLLVAWTLAVVTLVLVELNMLVGIDVGDPDASDE